MNKIVLKRICVTAIVINAAAFALSINSAAAGGPAQDYSLDQPPLGTEAWNTFCNPTFRADALGVIHWVYKHKGCEFGPYRIDAYALQPIPAYALQPIPPQEKSIDIGTEEGIRTQCYRAFSGFGKQKAGEKCIIDKLSEQKDREQGNNLNVHIQR